jgi:hypothetical protein
MNDEVRLGSSLAGGSESIPVRKFVPMQIGEAIVYVEQKGESWTETDSGIHPVAPTPKEAFKAGVEALKECVRVVGEHVEKLSGKTVPKQVEIEFSITFDAKAKGALIPVFVTAEHGIQTGLKVKAIWKTSSETHPRGQLEE